MSKTKKTDNEMCGTFDLREVKKTTVFKTLSNIELVLSVTKSKWSISVMSIDGYQFPELVLCTGNHKMKGSLNKILAHYEKSLTSMFEEVRDVDKGKRIWVDSYPGMQVVDSGLPLLIIKSSDNIIELYGISCGKYVINRYNNPVKFKVAHHDRNGKYEYHNTFLYDKYKKLITMQPSSIN